MCPRLIVAGLSGGSGKTIVSLGLGRAFVESGKIVQPFKKGPDYIDANWLGLSCQESTSNLDPFLFSSDLIRALFKARTITCDLALIEGNRGVFDGKNTSGTCSTSELARILNCPVLLVVDCTKITRTMAAVIKGCQAFEPDMHLAGVILNRTAGDRHRAIIRDSITAYTDVPVLGALPKIRHNPIPERHMGLTSDREMESGTVLFSDLARIIRETCDLEAIWSVACAAPPFLDSQLSLFPEAVGRNQNVTIGFVRDAALWFYYRENLEALEAQGAKLVQVSLLEPNEWPELDGLYLGGGFPETMADKLAEQETIRQRVKDLSDSGLPIYAECGGFMYLGRSLVYGDRTYPMAGVFPVTTRLCHRPQGHGYTEASVVVPNPFFQVGFTFSGHEFHYSTCQFHDGINPIYVLKMSMGVGMDSGHDGLVHENTYASYTHLHALGVPGWAVNFVNASRAFQRSKKNFDKLKKFVAKSA